MKKYIILTYILIGFALSFFIDNTLSVESYASDIASNTDIDNHNLAIGNNNPASFVKASEKAVLSVVHIKSKYYSNEIYGYYDPFYGKRFFNQPKENVASGSGVIISEDGYIITNRHVINNAEEIEVVLNDKRTYNAEILGEDPN